MPNTGGLAFTSDETGVIADRMDPVGAIETEAGLEVAWAVLGRRCRSWDCAVVGLGRAKGTLGVVDIVAD